MINQQKNDKITNENNRNITTDQGDDYKTGFLLDYAYFRDNYKMVVIDLCKEQALDADPSAIQQINFTAKLDRNVNTRIFLILGEAKETFLDFSQETLKFLLMYYRTI